MAGSVSPARRGTAASRFPAVPARRLARRRVSTLQFSVCSEISRAASTSMPRDLTVDSNLE
jgi:hypothetical protein